MSDSPETPKLILCIPGPWTSRSDLLERVISSGDHVFVGFIIMDIHTKFTCELEFEDTPDPNMARAFSLSDISEDGSLTQAIATHQSVAYLVGPGGSREASESMMLTAAALVKAGGLGVKVESSGIAHSAERWLELVSDLEDFSAHEALVVYVTGSHILSCGMHNLGLPEAAIDAEVPGASADLLKIFTRYLFAESPTIREGQTFSIDAEAPVFRLHFGDSVDYGAESLFNNPFGAWRLVPAEEVKEEVSVGGGFLKGLRSRWLN